MSTTAPAMYEGQKVGAIELVAHPDINVDSFRPLLAQKPGEPYSKAKVQQSIDALNRTSRFNKVELEVKPEPAGLRLTFVLEPAFYIGLIDFPGATKVFSYTRLLQAVNLPNAEPYQPKQVAAGQQALERFLRRNGFFEATVQAQTAFDEPHQLANIILQVTLNKRAKIGELRINGPAPQESEKLVAVLRSFRAGVRGASLKPGKKFTAERIQAASRYLRSYLASKNRLIKQLRPGNVQYHPETRRADVTFNLDLGPPVSVKVVGARLSRIPFMQSRTLRRLVPIFDEGAVDPELVLEGEQNLLSFFQGKGYFDAKVSHQIEQQPTKVSVVYNVVKGHRHKVAEVAVKGNRHFGDGDLLSRVAITEGHFLSHGHFSDKLLKQSVKVITKMYQDDGFDDVKVEPQVVDHEPKVSVTFNITEGEQNIVEDLKVAGNQHIPLPELQRRQGFELRPGTGFSQHRLNSDRDRIVALYLDKGFPRVTFNTKIDRLSGDKHRVNVTYNIVEGPEVRVSQLVTVGIKRTRPAYVARTVNIQPEAPLSQTMLLAGESHLYDNNVFDWASVGPRKPITDQTQEEVVVKVHEAKPNTVTYGFGLEIARRGGNVPSGTVAIPGLPAIGLGNTKISNSEDTFVSPRGSLEYIRRNFRGLGQTLTLSTLLARLDQRLLFTYADPHFRWTNWDSLFSLSVERTTENPIFTARLGDGTFQLQRYLDPAKTKTVQLRYSFQRTTLTNLLIPELVLPEDRSVRLSTISGSWIRDTRDKPLDAHRGIYDTIDLSITPTALGSSANFVRFLGREAYYLPFKKMVWANRVQVGLAAPFSGSRVPASERFFSGGGNSLRGFPINGAGPQRLVSVCPAGTSTADCNNNISVPVGGIQLFILNSELRFPIPVKNNLGGVIFYDGGNVYQHIRLGDLIDNYTNTVGFGIRYSTPIGPVRFDIGHNLNPVSGIKSTQFFVTLGQAF
jgi:outer membrane protein insertion porin family